MRNGRRIGAGALLGAGAALLARQLDAVRRIRVLALRLRHRRETPKRYDDTTLARKVETELFRPEDAPKGQVDVSAARGVVTLRGEVGSGELIAELVERTRKVQGVQGVESLLHTPDTPAPMHQ
jgi:osmotically-inducible protein OsmY